MPERTAYEPGTPSWVDLATSDPDGAKRFYEQLFGWRAEDAGPVEETGGYAFFLLDGRRIAGVGPVMGEGQPVVWSVYVSTDDADGIASRAREAGGSVLVEPMDVLDAGRMTIVAHPAGGVIGAWQPGQHTGAELVNDPGSFTWCELRTRDLAGAKAFGSAVFGWRPEDMDFGGMTYTILNVGDAGIAGMVALRSEVPAEVPAHWVTFFAVEDCDATVSRVQELGGSVTLAPMEVAGVGRFAGVADPFGAQFGVIRNEPGGGP